MLKRFEQRVCIKFCQKLDRTCTETIEMLRKVYESDTICDMEIKDLFKKFQDGQSSETESVVIRSSILLENIERVRVAIKQSRRLTIRQLMGELGIAKNIITEILIHYLQMGRLFTRFVPRMLPQYIKDNRIEIAEDNLETIKKHPGLLKKIITGDVTWIYGYEYNSSREAQCSHWMLDQPKRTRRSSNNVKLLLTVFFDYEGIVHHEFAPSDQTIDKEYYRQVLERLYNAVKLKRPKLWNVGNWIIHHDVPVHTSNLIREFLTKHAIIELRQPPYSPDISPFDYWLFPRLKKALNGSRFNNVIDFKENVTKQLMLISKYEFEESLQHWEKQWKQVVDIKGNYFEGDYVSIEAEEDWQDD
ncbi:hypothetical protein HZH66_000150 [Vespula vulgaris]|uniref:Mos1 transposase HTH domain-containing protein n=1 Tax=Vespula vulgaris TaxID=7454 RepID=A0A834KTY7_VESVU|nr:hypothetical protein HZH66_000150 [Vespula vulgaris]